MTKLLGGFWNGEAFDWKPGEFYDLQNDFAVQFFIPTTRVFKSPEEAIDFAAHHVRMLDWCAVAPGNLWSFDFDKLRARLSFDLPEWLAGTSLGGPVPRPTCREAPKPGELPRPDTLEITCRFVQRTANPEIDAVLEAANRPPDIQDSLSHFRQDFPDYAQVALVMMKFGETKLHNKIYSAIRETLSRSGLTAVRADEKAYHNNLFENVLTYLHGCRFGIAVFERLVGDEFNPNVSLELGYMLAMRKHVCLLKDATLRDLPADLMGRIYRGFDPQSPETTIPSQLESWMREKQLIGDDRLSNEA
ncbi:MAG TPA: hypothetical protein VN380_11475 [Thermoanaerobaculia bacterium]|jgi:hypothetical protein|nr:hypothetical protein [Thermoanaerobaculia bacterium]